MIKASINLQDLRRRIWFKAKAEPTWRFWGLYVHVCKMETLRAAYRAAKANNGAPGIDGVTFEAIEANGAEQFLENMREELTSRTYWPGRVKKTEIPKGDGKFRSLSIPSIRDRVVQGALKLILETIFEADFQDGSFGYRPKRLAHQAIERTSMAIIHGKTRVIDLDLRAYFDTVRHDILLRKVAERVQDGNVLHLLRQILKASGKRGVPQGGVISPLLANLYLNEVDKMLERAKEVTLSFCGRYTRIEYCRFADDLCVLIDGHRRWDWLYVAVYRRLQEELAGLDVQFNAEKTRLVDLTKGETFGFLGFDFRGGRTRQGKWTAWKTPKMKARTRLLGKLEDIFRRHRSQPTGRLTKQINPILRGWANYFRVGNSSWCFRYVRDWVERKVRRHLMRARGRKGFGWKRWSRAWMYNKLGLFGDYQIRYYRAPKVRPARSAT